MFKEFGLIFLFFIIVIAIFRIIVKKNAVFFGRLCIGLIVLTTIVNICYNLYTVYPTFVYEGVPIGDSEENLLVYKKDSQFQWQILHTMLLNRRVCLDQDGDLYERYFTIFANGVEKIMVTDEARSLIEKQTADFEEMGPMDMINQLDYAFLKWKGGNLPLLFINTQQLEGCDTLVAITTSNEDQNSLYVMSECYWQEILEQEELP